MEKESAESEFEVRIHGCSSPGATHHLACDCREAEWAEVRRENRELRDALEAERAAHAETRRAWAEMHSAFERARSETDAAGSALASERAAHEETKAGLDAAKRDYEGACHLVAKMHHAATGATQGPVQGVVEDVADVRERLAAAEECLREIAELPCSRFAAGFSTNCLAADPPEPCGPCRARAFLAGGKP